jgi:hypothetical protein
MFGRRLPEERCQLSSARATAAVDKRSYRALIGEGGSALGALTLRRPDRTKIDLAASLHD